MESIFKINVNDEYKPLLEDIVKVFVILTITDILNFMANNSKKALLFGNNYWDLLLFLLVGVCTYWLVFKKIIVFE